MTQTPLQSRFVADVLQICLSDCPTDVLTANNEKCLQFREQSQRPVMSMEDGQSCKLETTLITNPVRS